MWTASQKWNQIISRKLQHDISKSPSTGMGRKPVAVVGASEHPKPPVLASLRRGPSQHPWLSSHLEVTSYFEETPQTAKSLNPTYIAYISSSLSLWAASSVLFGRIGNKRKSLLFRLMNTNQNIFINNFFDTFSHCWRTCLSTWIWRTAIK